MKLAFFLIIAETIKSIDQSVNMTHFPLEFLNLGKVNNNKKQYYKIQKFISYFFPINFYRF